MVIFGCGERGKKLLNYLRTKGIEDEIRCCTDNAQQLWESKVEGYIVLSPEQVVQTYPKAIYIVANRYCEEVIRSQLQEMGIEKSNIYAYS